jgi:hypothetical protein
MVLWQAPDFPLVTSTLLLLTMKLESNPILSMPQQLDPMETSWHRREQRQLVLRPTTQNFFLRHR